MGHHSEPILEYSLVLTLTISSKTSSRTLPRPIFIQTVTSTAQCRSQTPTSPPQPPSTTSTPPSPPTRNAKTQSKRRCHLRLHPQEHLRRPRILAHRSQRLWKSWQRHRSRWQEICSHSVAQRCRFWEIGQRRGQCAKAVYEWKVEG